MPWFLGYGRKVQVGSEHENEYRWDTEGWPFFVGYRHSEIGETDYHIACGIQDLAAAELIAAALNAAAK